MDGQINGLIDRQKDIFKKIDRNIENTLSSLFFVALRTNKNIDQTVENFKKIICTLLCMYIIQIDIRYTYMFINIQGGPK